MTKEFSLAGKDWFTEDEAAHYCGVSLRQFQTHYLSLGIAPRRFMGKKLFAREELHAVISRSDPWHATDDALDSGSAVAKFCEAVRKAKTQEEKDSLVASLGGGPMPRSPLALYRTRKRRT